MIQFSERDALSPLELSERIISEPPMDPKERRTGRRHDHRTDHAKVTHTVGEVYSADSLSGLWTFTDRKTGEVFGIDLEGMQNVSFCLEILEAAGIAEVIEDGGNLYFENLGSHRFADGEIVLFRDPADWKNLHLRITDGDTTRFLRLLRKKEAKRRNIYNAKITKKLEKEDLEELAASATAEETKVIPLAAK